MHADQQMRVSSEGCAHRQRGMQELHSITVLSVPDSLTVLSVRDSLLSHSRAHHLLSEWIEIVGLTQIPVLHMSAFVTWHYSCKSVILSHFHFSSHYLHAGCRWLGLH
eukprot:GHVL01038691.1.p1 GENE.GHVL01038691.1~~GHVL01038691.1.p1  ORF type:complete len:108 (-),score=7.49 GHVL01038691.1:1019-1342(-)